jgi:mono/diheme cytochrome c family protein
MSTSDAPPRRRAALSALVCAVVLAAAGCDLIEKRTPGEKLWRKRCASCHGLDARGNTPGYMGNVNADLTDDSWVSGGDDGSIEIVVREGIFAKMPANDDLTRDEMKALLGHLRKLRSDRSQ